MEGGKWKKSSAELVELFHSVFPPEPALARQMFGYPAGFVNGNMFMALHEENFVLRLAEKDREKLLGQGGRMFEPMAGKPMKEYVVLPREVLSNRARLKRWVGKALDFGSSLPAKQRRKGAAGGR